ncbi:MAG: M56 family metallopeptidase [Prevotella sp.]|nr:M56 family metallopeptidase [Prevotella sp.]
MYTLETGLYPLTAILVAALLSAVYYGVVRMKCTARWAISFIFASMVVVTVCSFVSPMRWVEHEATAEVVVQPDTNGLAPVGMVGTAHEPQPVNKVHTPEQDAAQPRSIKPLLHNAASLLGRLWLAGVVVVLGHVTWQCAFLWRLRRRQQRVGQVDGYHLYAVDGTAACSFGRSVFIPREADDEMRHFMLLHELAHVQHRHFLWLCVLQVLVALNWYNPFCWLLMRELQLMQELQVDGDVLSQGVDREAYQYSLLRAAMQHSSAVWILSAFGRHSITSRMAFMQVQISPRSNHRRAWLSVGLTAMVLAATILIACQANEKRREHLLMGWWTLDLVRNTGSNTEVYLPFRQVGFRNYDTFLTIHYSARDGKSLSFGFSFSESRLKGDTLVDADGKPERYRFISDDTFEVQWTRQPYQVALLQGPEITDRWIRMPVDEDLRELFEIMVHADEPHRSYETHKSYETHRPYKSQALDGVWKSEREPQRYLLISDTLFMQLSIAPQHGPRTFHGGGSAYCGRLKQLSENWMQLGMEKPFQYRMADDDHLVFEGPTIGYYSRISMPYAVRRLLATPLTYEQIDYGQPEALLRAEDYQPPARDLPPE